MAIKLYQLLEAPWTAAGFYTFESIRAPKKNFNSPH